MLHLSPYSPTPSLVLPHHLVLAPLSSGRSQVGASGDLWRSAMCCPRCFGLMVPEFLLDATGCDRAEARRCILCAFTTDRVFEANRARQRADAFAAFEAECAALVAA